MMLNVMNLQIILAQFEGVAQVALDATPISYLRVRPDTRRDMDSQIPVSSGGLLLKFNRSFFIHLT